MHTREGTYYDCSGSSTSESASNFIEEDIETVKDDTGSNSIDKDTEGSDGEEESAKKTQ